MNDKYEGSRTVVAYFEIFSLLSPDQTKKSRENLFPYRDSYEVSGRYKFNVILLHQPGQSHYL
jgi:hypothetical protein